MAGSETGTQAHETFAKQRQLSTCRQPGLLPLDCSFALRVCSRFFSPAPQTHSSGLRRGKSTRLLGRHGLRFGRRQFGLTVRLSWFRRRVHSLERWFDMCPCQNHDPIAVLGQTLPYALLTSSRESRVLLRTDCKGLIAGGRARPTWDGTDGKHESPPLHILRCARAYCQSVGRCAAGVHQPRTDVPRVISMADSQI